MADYQATSATGRQLRVLSLNCWGLKYVADKRRQRLLAISDWIGNSSTPSAARLSSSSRGSGSASASYVDLPESAEGEGSGAEGYDIIALQEIWVRSDFDQVALRAKEAGLRHSRFFYSGCIGSGLAILSRFPITASFIQPFSLNGHPLHFIEGDFFAGKSVCGITVSVPVELGGGGETSEEKVEVMNCHMYAPGGEGEGPEGAHRVAQAWEVAKLVNAAVERGRHVLLTGDFNSQPHSIILRLLLSHASLLDAFAQTSPLPPSIDSHEHRSLTPSQVLLMHGITCDSPLNTYSAPKLKKRGPGDETVIRGGKRLDYVLYRSPRRQGTRGNREIVAVSTKAVLTELVPGLGVSYSDHFGLEVVMSLAPRLSSEGEEEQEEDEPSSALSTDDLHHLLHTLSLSLSHAQRSSTFLLQLFGASLIMLPLLFFASSYTPSSLSSLGWMWTLLGVVDGAGGATMLYCGFVGGYWEIGAVRNVIAEIGGEVERRRRLRDGGEASRTCRGGW